MLFDFLSVLVVGGGAVCLPMSPFWFSRAPVLNMVSLASQVRGYFRPSAGLAGFGSLGCSLLWVGGAWVEEIVEKSVDRERKGLGNPR